MDTISARIVLKLKKVIRPQPHSSACGLPAMMTWNMQTKYFDVIRMSFMCYYFDANIDDGKVDERH